MTSVDLGGSMVGERPPEQRNCFWRTFGAMGAGSVRGSILSLTSCAVGGGVLSLPYTFCLSGWAVGISAIVISALANIWSNQIIARIAIDRGLKNFDEIALVAGGKAMQKILEFMIMFA